MSDRKKLLELLKKAVNVWYLSFEGLVDYLISNGVTVQKWIPVSERLPKEDDADENGFVFAFTVENKKIITRWDDVCRFAEFCTHWMPLPEPPKECE